MATLDDIADALRNAHAAGDTIAANKLADAYVAMKGSQGTPPISADTEAGLRQTMPLTASDYLKADPLTAERPAMQPSLWQQLRASPVGEVGYGMEHTAGGLAQGAAHLLGDKDTAANIDASMARDARNQKMAYALSGKDLPVSIPGLSHPGETAGQMIAMAPVAAASGPALSMAGKISPYLSGGLAGAEFGALAPVDDDSKSYAGQKLGQVLAGGATGVAVPAIARGLTNAPTPSIPSVAELKSAADTLYKSSENRGVIISKASLAPFVDDVKQTLADEGIDKDLQPKAFAALQRLENAKNENVTLKGMDTLRKVAGSVLDSTDKSDRRMGHIIIDKIDDYVGNLKPSDVLAGNSQAAVDDLTNARDLWSRQSKGAIIDRALFKAQNQAPNFTSSGYENALRTQFRAVANNENVMRRFSSDEQDAILKVARGGPAENALRMLGKFAPRGVVSAALSSGMGAAVGGVPGAIALPLAGEASRMGATALTARNARLASELVRSGGVPVANASTMTPAITAFRNQSVSPSAIMFARALAAQASQ